MAAIINEYLIYAKDKGNHFHHMALLIFLNYPAKGCHEFNIKGK